MGQSSRHGHRPNSPPRHPAAYASARGKHRARPYRRAPGVLRQRLSADADLRSPAPATRRLPRRPSNCRRVRLDNCGLSSADAARGHVRQPAPGTNAVTSRPGHHAPPTTDLDPIVVEIVEGTLASAEAEVEAAIERTARSPMIREARDFRGGIHDRHCRKLTGRSYSALVQPIVRDFPIESIHEGDVFFHNDVYASEGGIGHLPDLCVTVPVHHEGEVVAFAQAFGHHDDIGGAVPGSMPSHGTSYFQEGLIVPPVRLYEGGRPNTDLIRVMVRNSRLPESLRGDLDAEVSACRMGAERLAELFSRYGQQQVEECFEAILARTTAVFRDELLSKIPAGTYTWEDYAEHDGVDPPRLH